MNQSPPDSPSPPPVSGGDQPGQQPGQQPGGATVSRDGRWAVGMSGGEPFAVSRRCRHQLADLSAGHVDADGCLVCPWHQSRYDAATGRMVTGPRGFFGYHGPSPGYTGIVRALGQVLPLRRTIARVLNGRVRVDRGS